jgi:NAD+ kinase
MPTRFRHAALVGKYQAQGIRGVLEEIAHFLVRQGLEVSLERQTALSTGITDYGALEPAELGQQCDLAVVLGGDGTMLGIARQLAGFITDVSVGQFAEVLAPMIAGDYEVEHRSMLEGGVLRDGETIFEALALNDVVVSRSHTASMVELRIDIGDEFMANLRADGLILASPTGSTAYALSAGGPILHPSIAGWVMAPIASHTLSNRPIVLPDVSDVTIEIVVGRDSSVNFDMQGLASLLPGDRIVVRRSQHQVHFLHPRGWSYYATLRKKLHWHEGVV